MEWLRGPSLNLSQLLSVGDTSPKLASAVPWGTPAFPSMPLQPMKEARRYKQPKFFRKEFQGSQSPQVSYSDSLPCKHSKRPGAAKSHCVHGEQKVPGSAWIYSQFIVFADGAFTAHNWREDKARRPPVRPSCNVGFS
jgi:hypothetical protein